MFTELMTALQDTMMTVTISRIADQLLGVNIIPKRETDTESNARLSSKYRPASPGPKLIIRERI